jgi:hypothetical protein
LSSRTRMVVHRLANLTRKFFNSQQLYILPIMYF